MYSIKNTKRLDKGSDILKVNIGVYEDIWVEVINPHGTKVIMCSDIPCDHYTVGIKCNDCIFDNAEDERIPIAKLKRYNRIEK